MTCNHPNNVIHGLFFRRLLPLARQCLACEFPYTHSNWDDRHATYL